MVWCNNAGNVELAQCGKGEIVSGNVIRYVKHTILLSSCDMLVMMIYELIIIEVVCLYLNFTLTHPAADASSFLVRVISYIAYCLLLLYATETQCASFHDQCQLKSSKRSTSIFLSHYPVQARRSEEGQKRAKNQKLLKIKVPCLQLTTDYLSGCQFLSLNPSISGSVRCLFACSAMGVPVDMVCMEECHWPQ